MIYAALAVFLAGSVLLTLALRGRRLDNHPICRQCRFDLVGTPCDPAFQPASCDAGFQPAQESSPEPTPDSSPRCPECGATITSPRALRIGNRRRCPRTAVLAMVILLAGLIPAGLMIWGHAAGIDQNRYKPAWWLAGDLNSSDLRTSNAAAREFTRRLMYEKLNHHWRTQIVELSMERYLDETGPWSHPWGNLLDMAWQRGLLNPQQEVKYLQNIVQLELMARDTIAQDLRWAPQLHVSSPRAGTTSSLTLEAELLHSQLNGEQVTEPRAGAMMTALSSQGSSSKMLGIDFTQQHIPGAYEFKGQWRLSLYRRFQTEGKPLMSWESELSTTVELVPAGTEIVQRIAAPHLAEQMKRSVRLEPNIQPAEAPVGGSGMIFLDSPPMPAAFRFYCRLPDPESEAGFREWYVGSITSGGTGSSGASFNTRLPSGITVDSVDVILRACPAAAARTSGIMEIWDGEIVIRNVPATSPDAEDP